MYISFNASAVIANNSLNRTDNKLQDSLARLSSGLKVVNPKDNPSGLAMAKRMNAQIKGTDQANSNAGDGISIIEIADGTMNEISEMLQRMNELANKACNGTLTDDDREMIDKEIQQLKTEITRISNDTSFNAQPILDGSFDLKGYTDNIDVKVAYYGEKVTYGEYDITGALNIALKADGTINKDTSTDATQVQLGTNPPIDVNVSYSGNTAVLRNDDGFELKLEIHKAGSYSGTKLDLVGFGAMDMQIGANEGQQINIRIPKMSLENMEIANVKVTSVDDANEALENIKRAIKYVSSARADLGAYQNRLEHTTSTLAITSENMTAAYSRIMDVDMAEEMTEYTTLQILSQASTSMLAQANERPSQVLQLLQ
ncbi:MAG: flagellin [Lachnospiraceae bacterium]|nr:flagellin [Lachnospiraceae bacterium]